MLRKLFTGNSSLQFYQILRFAGVFIAGIFLARMSVPLGEIGLYESFLFISVAAGSFWINGIINSLLSIYNAETKGNIYYNSFILLSALSIVFCLLIFLFQAKISEIFGIDSYAINLLSIYFILNNPSFLNEYIFFLEKKYSALVCYALANFILFVSAVFFPLFLSGNIYYCFYGLIFFAGIKFLILLVNLKVFSKFQLNFQFIKDHLYLAFPLILASLIASSADYIDGFIVSHFFGKDMFAIFRYGSREFPISLLMANALSAAIIPLLSSNIFSGLTELRKQSLKLMHIIFPLTILLLIFSPWLYQNIFSTEFIGSAAIFNVFLLLSVCRMVFPQSIIMGLKKNKIILSVALIEITINIVFSILFSLKFGLIGVAYGTVLAFYAEKIILISYLAFSEKIFPDQYIPLKALTIYTLILFLTFLYVNS